MTIVEMSTARLADLIARFRQCRIAVLGDFFLDKYLDVDPELAEVSVETGRTAHQVVDVRCRPGAAGTVVCNLAALGAGALHAIGFTGDDGEAYDLRKELDRLGCGTDYLHRAAQLRTPTYLKPRDVNNATLEGEHSRYDTKNRATTPAILAGQMIQSLHQVIGEVDAVIILDQVEQRDCGVVTGTVRDAVASMAAENPDTVFWADSRRRIGEFAHVIIKPNQFEAVGKSDPRPGEEVDRDELVCAVEQMRSKNQAPVVVTCGAEGMLVSDPQWTVVPGVPVRGEIDPTGAGDSATAGAVLALCAGAQLPEAALVGNLVASLTVQQIGTTGVAHPEQLPAAHEAWQQR